MKFRKVDFLIKYSNEIISSYQKNMNLSIECTDYSYNVVLLLINCFEQHRSSSSSDLSTKSRIVNLYGYYLSLFLNISISMGRLNITYCSM